jgi:hypothetical protein
VLQVLLVRDFHRTRLAKPAELRWGAGRFKPLGGVAVSGIIATLWLPTSAALIGHGLFSWPRGVFHEPAVSALSIYPPALYGCVLSRLLASGTRPAQRSTVRTVGDLPDATSTVLPEAIAGGRGCVAPYARHLATLLSRPLRSVLFDSTACRRQKFPLHVSRFVAHTI